MYATRLPYEEAERQVEAGKLCRFCYVDDSENDVTYLDKDGNFYVAHQAEEDEER
jgi:hypothetical protein